MAAGDTYQATLTSVANNGTLNFQPASGAEFVLHNIYYGGSGVELYITDGTNTLKFDADATFGGRLNLSCHCTNTLWVRVKNVSGGAQYVTADGMYTR